MNIIILNFLFDVIIMSSSNTSGNSLNGAKSLASILGKKSSLNVSEGMENFTVDAPWRSKSATIKLDQTPDKNDNDRSSFERTIPYKKWNKPPENKQIFGKNSECNYPIGSIARLVSNLRKEIILRATGKMDPTFTDDDIDCFNKFREKFLCEKQSWEQMMDKLLQVALYSDKLNLDNIGIKEMLKIDFVNIILSWILIGHSSRGGRGVSGIDNIDGVIKSIPNNSPSIEDYVNEFISQLPIVLDKIVMYQKEIKKLDDEQKRMMIKENKRKNLTDLLLANIRVQEKELDKMETSVGSSNNDIIENLRENLEDGRSALLQATNDIKEIQENIKEKIKEKTQKFQSIWQEYEKIRTDTKFTYFMQKNWFPWIDYGLYREN